MSTKRKYKVNVQTSAETLGEDGGVWMFALMARAVFINGHPELYESQIGPMLPTFEEEFHYRWMLVHSAENLLQQGKAVTSPYLNDLVQVSRAGFLPEYIWHYLAGPTWSIEHQPKNLPRFLAWATKNLNQHKVLTKGNVQADIETMPLDLGPAPVQPQPLDIKNGGGEHLRDSTKLMMEAFAKKNYLEAMRLADDIMKAARALQNQSGAFYCCFKSQETLNYFVKDRPDIRVIRVLDWCIAEAMLIKAVVLVTNNALADALKLLNEISALAPLWADPFIEKGYIFNRTKRLSEALTACTRGWDLVTLFPENAQYAGHSLRGLAVALVSLGSLDRAKQLLEDSLVIEPGNPIALRELLYIKFMKRKK